MLCRELNGRLYWGPPFVETADDKDIYVSHNSCNSTIRAPLPWSYVKITNKVGIKGMRRTK